MRLFIAFLVSWLVVAFGQPSHMYLLAPIASCCGYAILWRQLLNEDSTKRKFLISFFWFFCVQLIQLSWMTSIEFQGMYMIFVYIACCLVLGAQFGALSIFVNRIPHVAVASLWALIEWARLYLLCGFSWNPVGLSLTAFNLPSQMASIFGIIGLSFWVIITNLAVLKNRWKVWAALSLFPYVFGVAHILFHSKALEKSPRLTAALVQTGLKPSQKIVFKGREKEFISPYDQWQRIVYLLKNKNQKFDLIVLPESVVPVAAEERVYSFEMTKRILEETMGPDIKTVLTNFTQEEKVSNKFWMHTIADFFSAEVIAGMDSLEKDRIYSSAFYIQPKISGELRYEKQVLVPLAEYIPFLWLKKFTEKYGVVEFFTKGKESKVFKGKVPFSVSICYEETFGHLVRKGRLRGAELFINVSNDNWYPSSSLAKQHFDHGRIRTLENGVPSIRACNAGVTAIVDSLGRTIAKIDDLDKRAILAASFPTYTYRTLYMFWGNWGIVGCCVILLVIAYFGSRRKVLK